MTDSGYARTPLVFISHAGEDNAAAKWIRNTHYARLSPFILQP